MPRRGRRRRFWPGADSYFESVSAGSIDRRSESAHHPEEGRWHGPAELGPCRYASSGVVCEQPWGHIGHHSGTSCGNRRVGSSLEKEGYFSSAFRTGGRAYFLIIEAAVDPACRGVGGSPKPGASLVRQRGGPAEGHCRYPDRLDPLMRR